METVTQNKKRGENTCNHKGWLGWLAEQENTQKEARRRTLASSFLSIVV